MRNTAEAYRPQPKPADYQKNKKENPLRSVPAIEVNDQKLHEANRKAYFREQVNLAKTKIINLLKQMDTLTYSQRKKLPNSPQELRAHLNNLDKLKSKPYNSKLEISLLKLDEITDNFEEKFNKEFGVPTIEEVEHIDSDIEYNDSRDEINNKNIKFFILLFVI